MRYLVINSEPVNKNFSECLLWVFVRCFQKRIFKTGLIDHLKLILSFFHSCFSWIPPKTIPHWKYETFNATKLLHELDQELLKGGIHKSNKDMFLIFMKTFSGVYHKNLRVYVHTNMPCQTSKWHLWLRGFCLLTF